MELPQCIRNGRITLGRFRLAREAIELSEFIQAHPTAAVTPAVSETSARRTDIKGGEAIYARCLACHALAPNLSSEELMQPNEFAVAAQLDAAAQLRMAGSHLTSNNFAGD